MDVNGTKFHLLYSCEDWGMCSADDAQERLVDRWKNAGDHPPVDWDCDSRSLRLAREIPLFQRQEDMPVLDISMRRGAGRDSFGNWYWIDADEGSIRLLRNGESTSVLFWSAGSQDGGAINGASAFAGVRSQRPMRLLRGLAVTQRNYLVVGDVTNSGLLVFDLFSSGVPSLHRWPKGVNFTPWDLAATPDGRLLVLDREHSTYWVLDAHLRLQGGVQEQESPFQPINGSAINREDTINRPPTGRNVARKVYPHGFPLTKGDPPVPIAAVSIETGPDCHVLILETDLSADAETICESDGVKRVASTIYEYDGPKQVASYSLACLVEVMDPAQGEGLPEIFPVVGHDLAYIEDGGADAQLPGCNCPDDSNAASGTQTRHVVYVADHRGKQAFGFVMDRQAMGLRSEQEFLPLRRWDGKGIVVADQQVYYDFLYNKQERWVPLMMFAECHYVGSAVLTTPTEQFTSLPAKFDRQAVTVANDGGRVAVAGTVAGASDGWAMVRASDGRAMAVASNGGTMAGDGQRRSAATTSLVVDTGKLPPAGGPFDSNIPGCIWHRLILDAQIPQGTSVSIRARASDDPQLLLQTRWSPQPAPYLRSGGAEIPYYYPWKDMAPDQTGTWELLFQEIRGRYLQLELTLEGSGRATPTLRALRAWYPRFSYLDHYLPAMYREDPVSASFLDRWLANFEGLYTNLEDKIEHVAELFDPCTAPAETLEWLACWFGLVLDPQWDEQRRRLLIQHVDQFYRLRGTRAGIEIAVRLYIEDTVNESLFDLRCLGTGKVRIVEQFQMGDGSQVQPQGGVNLQGAINQAPTEVAAAGAHRFSVLLPSDFPDERLAMVKRIVELEKPAHTAFEINRSWDFFSVGGARLGIDTQLGESNQFTEMLLGDSYLAETYLDGSSQLTVADRPYTVSRQS